MATPKSDIEIARAAELLPIEQIAETLSIPDDALYRYGPHKAKVSFDFLKTLQDRPTGRLILVTAMTPTPAGEGKTTMTVGLGDGLNRIGKKTAICLREPSLGPCFGMKGGAAGGGYAQVVPMEDINLHFTGDMHAIGAAHNLLAAMIDNHVYWGNGREIDSRRISWRRVVDMNDRALRDRGAVAGRRRQRVSTPERLRHHGRVGGDGDLLSVARRGRFAAPPRQDPGRRDAGA